MGLELDSTKGSRIFELRPNYKEFLFNNSKLSLKETCIQAIMPKANREGPSRLYKVNTSARRRFLEAQENLSDKAQYRPRTLERVADELSKLDPTKLGIGPNAVMLQPDSYTLHDVKAGDTLRSLAAKYYGDPNQSDRILQANLDIIDDPDTIYVGHSLRIPK